MKKSCVLRTKKIFLRFIATTNNTNDEWFDVYVIKKGDNLYSIAEEYNVDLVDLLNINGLDKDNYIYPGQEILVPKRDIRIIITKDKETVNSASKRLGLNSDELLFQNDNIFLLPEQLLINKNRKVI